MVTFLSCPGDMDIGLHIYTDIYVCDKGEQEERVFFFVRQSYESLWYMMILGRDECFYSST